MKTLAANLEIVKKLLRKDYDWLHLNIGFERSGKSNLGIQEALIVDPTMSVDRITFTQADFKKAIDKAKFYQCVIADEGAESFLSKDAMRPENVINQKLLTKIGAKRLFIIINIPDFFLLDPYIRGHRVRSMCRIVGRGSIAFYSKAKTIQIKRDPENRSTIFPEPNFFDIFSSLENDKGRAGKLWKEYIKKKMEYLSRRTQADKMADKADAVYEKTFSMVEVARMFHIPKHHVYLWVKRKRIKCVKTPLGRNRIPKCEVERMINSYGKQTKKLYADMEKKETTES